MGYATLYFRCLTCGLPACGNPDKVVSIPVTFDAGGRPHPDEAGAREPICETCARRANEARVEAGLAPFPIAPDAYEAAQVW